MKIKTIQVVNYKALAGKKIDFNGASAIITGGNNQGLQLLIKSPNFDGGKIEYKIINGNL